MNDDPACLIFRQESLRTGASVRTFDAAVACGDLLRVGRGAYIPAETVRGEPQFRRRQIIYRLRCLAAAVPGKGERVLSHQSAAALHRLELLHPEYKHVHFTKGKPSGGYAKGRLTVVHSGVVPDRDVVEIDGVRATGLARTVIDVATSSSFPRALAAFDAGLKRGLDADDLLERLTAPRRGVGAARYALGHADALAANPGESWCRAQMIQAGFPTPALQRRYDFADGTYAEVDHDFDGLVVVEFDGITKYSGDCLREGQTPADVVVAEKIREDKLRELGLDVVRILWSGLRQGTMVPTVGRVLQKHGLWRPGALPEDRRGTRRQPRLPRAQRR